MAVGQTTRGLSYEVEGKIIESTVDYIRKSYVSGYKTLSKLPVAKNMSIVRKEIIVLRVMKYIIDTQLDYLRLQKLKV